MQSLFRVISWLVLASTALLVACGGGGGGGTPATPSTATYAVNVTVSGLDTNSTQLVLQNNAADDLSINADGTYAFNTQIEDGQAYSVTVLSQPTAPNQVCTVTNPSGNVNGAPVSNISVTCSTFSYSLGFNVSNLAGTGLVIANDAGDAVDVAVDGSYTFPQALADGSSYSVTITRQPQNPDQICTVSQPGNEINGADVNNVDINCTTVQPNTYTIGGTVTGLLADSFVLQNNAGDNLTVNGNGKFVFQTTLASGSSYTVTVLDDPIFNICEIANNTGNVGTENISDIVINCEPKRYSVSVSVTGMNGQGLVLQNHGRADLAIPTNDIYTFDTLLPLRFPYNVTVLTQPTNIPEICIVVNGVGEVTDADNIIVQVDCITESYTLGGTVTGFTGDSMLIQNRLADDLMITGNGYFEFPSRVEYGHVFSITIEQQPNGSSYPLICEVVNGFGFAFRDITDVEVNCILQVNDIVADGHTSCAILSNAGTKCWGGNGSGQLGQGHTDAIGSTPEQMGNNLAPINFGTELYAQQITASENSNCAILTDNKIKCFGLNTDGELGQGHLDNVGDEANEMGDVLAYTEMGFGLVPVQISGGGNHFCAVMASGGIKCWGKNQFGELGLGDTENRGDEPNEMANSLPYVDLGPDVTASQVSTGIAHTCALLNDNRIKCWGRSAGLGLEQSGNRGDDAGEMGDNLPRVDLGTRNINNILVPVRALQVVTGFDYTCALLATNEVKCWGSNTYGQLGQGHTDLIGRSPGEMGNALPVVNLGTGRTAIQIAASNGHTCALLDDNTVKCWGLNSDGQLGLGDTEHRGDEPDEMGDNLPVVELGSNRTVVKISAANSHTCALFDSGETKCWGRNFASELGLGDREGRGDEPREMGDNLPRVNVGTQ